MHFFVAWAEREDLSGDSLMKLALEACQKINRAMRIMYRSDVWLNRNGAQEVSTLGLEFMECYKNLATQAYAAGRALFPHMPKGHSMDHIFFQLKIDLDLQESAQHFLNPLCHSVQISEDFVGRTSRISRRTAPLQVITRVLQRSLQASYKHWHKEGFIKA